MAWVPEGEKEQDSARQSAGDKEEDPQCVLGCLFPLPPQFGILKMFYSSPGWSCASSWNHFSRSLITDVFNHAEIQSLWLSGLATD